MGFIKDLIKGVKGEGAAPENQASVVQPVTAPIDRLAVNSAIAGIQRSMKDISGLDLSDDAIRDAKRQADSGLPMQYYRYILKGVLRDGHIGGIISDLMRRTVSYPFDIEIPDEIKDDPDAQAQVDFLKMALSGINFDAVRQRAAWGTFWPTLQEVVFEEASASVRGSFGSNGLPGFIPVVPVSVTALPNLYLQSDTDGNLLYIQDNGQAINLGESEGRFIFAIDPEDEDQLMIRPVPFTELGSQKRVFDMWVDKVYTRSDGRKYRNRFAEPMLDIAYDAKDANAIKDADVIYGAYNSNGKLRSIKHPVEMMVQYMGADAVSTTSVFRDDLAVHNSEATKGLKGQDMSTEKDSTRATSTTGMAYDDELLSGICATRDQILTDQLLLVIRDLNYPEGKRFPMRLTTVLPEEFKAPEVIRLVESASAMGREFTEGELNELYRLPGHPDRENFVLTGLAKSNPFRL
ncbi:MAG: hypothetical protein HGB35_00080 [Geobacteraceae bacterium]|nr:hypothetical protein [Geobacteraceae bacterium]